MVKGKLSKTFEPQTAEKKLYQYWLDHDLFHAHDTSSQKPFSVVIPPPNVTGMLHMGHALNNVLQDIMVRFRRMQGYNTLWMPGTDHAGIATQNVVEQELAKEGISRHDLGREKFIERVWQWKAKYGGVIINQLKRLGCSCDWARERFTMDEGLSRAVREVFVRLYHDGLIYQGDYIVNWCPRCHTAISDLEVEYIQEEGALWHIRYPFVNGNGGVVVATTRPETMLGDTAVAVNPHDERYKELIGKEVLLPLVNKVIPIIADEYVAMEFGSGAVKITPAHDPNDFAIAGRHHLEIVKIMDGSAVINENGGSYRGQDRYTCRENVLKDLEEQSYLVSKEKYLHSIGQCYRCKTNIEPMVSMQWFVKIQPLAKKAIEAVAKKETKIVPSSWEGTYFEWMSNIRDWCISRQIWWGHRIPVWYCDHCKETIVSTQTPQTCPTCKGVALKQEEDVLDTWFSSALWPFSTLGWPDESAALKTFYPTSLLITGFDILFFWVARMMMMGLYVMGDVPFRDIYLHALVRDDKGEKMSKSKGNIIDPLEMIDKYGADAFRFTLAAFTAQGRDIRMSEDRIEGYKFFINKIWNATKFSIMNLADYPAEGVFVDRSDESLPDRWIKDRLNKTISEVNRGLDEYRFNDAAAGIYQFIWHEFCDWYIELIKPALYNSNDAKEKLAAQHTLLTVLKASLKLLHPFAPFVTEEIWQALSCEEGSIMISEFPLGDESYEDAEAARQMDLIINIISAVRNIRGEMRIAPSKKLHATVSVADKDSLSIVKSGKNYIINLANLDGLDFGVDINDPKGVATSVVGSMKVFVSLAGLINLDEEKARLEKEIVKLQKDIAFISKKLDNQDFLQKASEDVIKKEKVKYQEFTEKHRILKAALSKIRTISL
jgi:valyl-tRNA synthetase